MNTGEFHQDDAQRLGTRRHIQVHQFLHRHRVGQVVADRIHIIQPVRHDFGLLVRFGFHVLLDAGMQETDVGDAVDHRLAIQFEQQAQHTMRGGVLRAHVQQHGFALDGALRDQVFQIINGYFLDVTHGCTCIAWRRSGRENPLGNL